MATAALFLGTGVSCRPCSRPFVVARLERPPPRFVLPTIYAAEAAAFLGLALLVDNFSLAAVVVDRRDRRRPGPDREDADPRGHRGDARARGRAARRQRDPQRRLHRRRRGRPGGRRAALVAGLRRPVGAAARRGLLLRDRLDPLHRQAAAPRRARARQAARAGPRRARLHPRQRHPRAPDRRRGRRPRLLLRRGPDRGRLRQGDPRRRATRGYGVLLGQLGRRDGARQRRLRRPCGERRCRSCCSSARSAIARRLPGHGRRARPSPSPASPSALGGDRQRRAVGARWSARCRS